MQNFVTTRPAAPAPQETTALSYPSFLFSYRYFLLTGLKNLEPQHPFSAALFLGRFRFCSYKSLILFDHQRKNLKIPRWAKGLDMQGKAPYGCPYTLCAGTRLDNHTNEFLEKMPGFSNFWENSAFLGNERVSERFSGRGDFGDFGGYFILYFIRDQEQSLYDTGPIPKTGESAFLSYLGYILRF